MASLPPTPRTTVRRLAQRATYDRTTIHAILDEGLVCHLGFVHDGQPYVIPTNYVRWGDHLVIHGSGASRMLRALKGGVPVCVTVTLLDGLVLARSAFHHSVNYRSVVILGTADEVADPAERMEALHAFVEHVLPGRWKEVRPPSEKELRATLVLKLPITEASAKIRSGPPVDDEEDYALSCWAGVVPLALTAGAPVPDDRLAAGIEPPAGIVRYRPLGS
jgi:nitroimidazol reductase NimA-like FMN-containing flavoprotein (pyridoxamine 5'-phosphate oxidase superfamily)